MLEMTSKRLDRGWSKSELGRRAKMTAADIGKIESRRLVPYESQLKKIAKALGVPPASAQRLLKNGRELRNPSVA